MNYLKRRNKQIFCKAKLRAAGDCVWDNLRQPATEMRGLEDVFEDASDIDPGSLICIKSERAVAKIQRANIVKTKNVISMTVSDQDGVEPFQTIAQCLLAKIGRRVDQDRLAHMLDEN